MRPSVRLVPPPPPKPEIRVNTEIQRMTDEAIAVLAADARNYQRSGQLVGVVLSDPKTPRLSAKVERAQGTPIIRTLKAATICERLANDARWITYKNGEWVSAVPPSAVVGAVLERGEWAGMRGLSGIVTHPCLRPDWTVLQTPGYDEATGILYRPNDNYPEIGERPGRDDALACLAELREVTCDYPFAAPHHESAWLAGVLTMLARPAIAGPVPLFAINGNVRGVGKSRMVDAAILLCHGEVAARMPMSRDEEEMRKRITSLLVEGIGAVLIDNVRGAVGLECLDTLFTGDTWSDRVLGTTSTVRVPARAVWWLTGNNFELGGDMARRTIHIRLESRLENPEERTDLRHPDLLDWVRRERRRLVACALTVLRAAAVASVIPCGTGLWGSFESWSAVVPPVLKWLDMPSPLDARATTDTADDEKASIGALLDGLRRLCPKPDAVPQPMSARAIVDALYPQDGGGPRPRDGYEALRDAIEGETRTQAGRRPDVRRLGKWLSRAVDRPVSGWALRRHPGPEHSALWRAEAVGASVKP